MASGWREEWRHRVMLTRTDTKKAADKWVEKLKKDPTFSDKELRVGEHPKDGFVVYYNSEGYEEKAEKDRRFKFTAKAEMSDEELDNNNIPHEQGWITGWYSDGYLLGDVIEVDEEYIAHEWWCKVDKSTVKEAE